MEMDSLSTPLHIDLYNFEDPRYEDGKYVLTSPRSLEACARVGVKPVELLYKPLADFQDEFLTDATTLQTVYTLYDEHENDRLKKLKLCRAERDRLVNEDDVKSITRLSPIPGSFMRTASPSGTRPKSPSVGPGSRLTFASDSASLLLDNHLKAADKDFGNEKESNASRRSPLDKASMQRIRTAWATSGGDGDILSNGKDTDRENEEKHLFETNEKSGFRLRSSSLERPRNPTMSPARESMRSRRTLSASEKSFASESTWASVLKSSMDTAKPILDMKLRSKLKGCKTANVRLPDRDHKILSRLVAKEEEEKELARIRKSAQNVWEEEKKKDLQYKQREEARRRSRLIQKMEERQKKMTVKDCKRREEEEVELHDRLQKIEISEKQWEEHVAKLEREKRQKLIEKKETEMKRRRSVERNLQSKEKELEEFQKMVIQYQDHSITKANAMKEAQLHEDKLKRKHQNVQEMKDFKKRHEAVKKMTEEDRAALRASIEYKHKKAQENFDNISTKKCQEIEDLHRERDKQEKMTKRNVEKMDKDLEAYRKDLLVYRKVKEEQADEIYNSVVMKKKQRAQEERAQREALQRQNLKKQQQEEAVRLRDMKEVIAWKDAKSQVILDEKEQTVSQLRALAHTSELLRGELKSKYNKDSFDKKVQQVELESKIGAGYRGSVRNTSSVKLY